MFDSVRVRDFENKTVLEQGDNVITKIPQFPTTHTILEIIYKEKYNEEKKKNIYILHLSPVTCYLSYVMCQLSHVKCHHCLPLVIRFPKVFYVGYLIKLFFLLLREGKNCPPFSHRSSANRVKIGIFKCPCLNHMCTHNFLV